MVGPKQLMFATDHPWVDPEVIIPIVDHLPVSTKDRDLIYSGNAARLFHIEAETIA